MKEKQLVEITPELIDKIKEETKQTRKEIGDVFGDDIKVMEHSYIYITSNSTDQKARELGRLMRKNKEKSIRKTKEFIRTKETEFEADPAYIRECEETVDEVYRRYLNNTFGETLFRLERSFKYHELGKTTSAHKKYKTRRSMTKYEKRKLRRDLLNWVTGIHSIYEDKKCHHLTRKFRPVAKEEFENFRKKYPQYEINFDEVNYNNPKIEVTFWEAFSHYNL